jgi:NAD(P)-dependent dehydrogenase (short-subunit alcohol dehydrogenase family)
MNLFSLQNENALITGGGTGLGLGIAQSMVQAGARVVLVGRREEPLVAAVKQLGTSASYLVADVTQHERAGDLVKAAGEKAGCPVSILVNNAGNHLKKTALETSLEDFNVILQTHVIAAHSLSRAVLPSMIERGHGNILFIASMASFIGVPNVFAYSAAKTAVLGMVRALTAEVAARGVRVNAIAPGWIESDMSRKALDADAKRKEKVFGRTPMGRMGQPADIGGAAVYLCSPAAQFVTGVVLPVDGGASIGF